MCDLVQKKKKEKERCAKAVIALKDEMQKHVSAQKATMERLQKEKVCVRMCVFVCNSCRSCTVFFNFSVFSLCYPPGLLLLFVCCRIGC